MNKNPESEHNVKYGTSSESQFLRFIPPTISQLTQLSMPTFVIIHGGFWKLKYGIDNSAIESIQPFLTAKGYGVCLIEYRRVGDCDGGYPETNNDVISALHHLYKYVMEKGMNVNFDKFILMGHSAGGTLCLWTCCQLSRHQLPFKPFLCVALSPIGNLCDGVFRRLSDDGDAVIKYMAGIEPCFYDKNKEPNNCRCIYREASPHQLLPLEVDTLLVSGGRDTDVPADLVRDFYEVCCHSHSHSHSHTTPVSQYNASTISDSNKNSNSYLSTNAEEAYAPLTINNKLKLKVQLLELQNCDHYQMVDTTQTFWVQIWNAILMYLDNEIN